MKKTNPKDDALNLGLRYELTNGKHGVDGREGAVKTWVAVQGWEFGATNTGPTTTERRIVDQQGRDRGRMLMCSDHPQYAVAFAV